MSKEARPVVYVIDDDSSVCQSLADLISSAGLEVEVFQSPQEFLARDLSDQPSCLVLDVKMPGITGLELQQELAAAKRCAPIIFITAYGTVKKSVEAMKRGAVDFLEKPFDGEVLLNRIHYAIGKDIANRTAKAEAAVIRRRYDRLTKREKEVFALVVAGLLNKQVAHRLGVTEAMIKAHRARIMCKLETTSLADLVRIAEKLQESDPPTAP